MIQLKVVFRGTLGTFKMIMQLKLIARESPVPAE